MVDTTTTIATYSGPLHGIVLRGRSNGDYMVHAFNTPAAVERYGYKDGYYLGDYLDTLDEALEIFAERVRNTLRRGLAGDVAECARKDRERAYARRA